MVLVCCAADSKYVGHEFLFFANMTIGENDKRFYLL